MPIKQEDRGVTPQWASQVLEKHYERVNAGKYHQRSITVGAINKYAQDMAAGNWDFTPEPIIFDENGDLANGQHRLEAVRKSGKTIKMRVEYGWPKEILTKIDSGRTRSIHAMLQLQGWKYTIQYTGAVKKFAEVACGTRRIGLTYSIALYLLDKLDIKTAIDRVMSQVAHRSSIIKDFRGSLVGPLAYYWTVKPKKALEFAESYFNFNVEKDSAVQALLNWEKGISKRSDNIIRAVCGAIRRWDANEKVSNIKPTQEAVEWLANQNPALRERIRKLMPSTK